MTWIEWYNSLEKPSWTPEPSTIGFVWQCLYPIIMITFGFVFVQALRKKLPWMVAVPFGINLVANLIFTPIQFGMRNLPLAAVDIVIVWASIIWMMVTIQKHCRWVGMSQMAHFAWVSIADVEMLVKSCFISKHLLKSTPCAHWLWTNKAKLRSFDLR